MARCIIVNADRWEKEFDVEGWQEGAFMSSI